MSIFVFLMLFWLRLFHQSQGFLFRSYHHMSKNWISLFHIVDSYFLFVSTISSISFLVFGVQNIPIFFLSTTSRQLQVYSSWLWIDGIGTKMAEIETEMSAHGMYRRSISIVSIVMMPLLNNTERITIHCLLSRSIHKTKANKGIRKDDLNKKNN